MRMHLEQDGTLGALGFVESYPYKAPDFIVMSGHLRWKYNGGDMANQANWTELEPTFEEIEIQVP